VSRQWRDLKLHKWHGYGHVTDVMPGPGDLAVFCPTCPQPGVNIPEGWKEEGEQYVPYMIILGIHTYFILCDQVDLHSYICDGWELLH